MSYTHCDMTNTRTYLTRTAVDRAAIRQHTWLILNMRHDSFLCVTWLIHICVKRLSHTHRSYKTHSRAAIKQDTWLITHGHDSFLCMTRLILVWDMTHSCVWHDSFLCVTWRIHICETTLSLSHPPDKTQGRESSDETTCMSEHLQPTHRLTYLLLINHVTHTNMSCQTNMSHGTHRNKRYQT